MDKETRKVVPFGNSVGVGIPKKILETLNIHRGDEMEFEIRNDEIVMRKKEKLEDQVDPEMLKMLQETFRDHNELLERLK
ncbi:AbrB/MazE/SpoVT family DNA-binding domain-containing protein [Lentibacillus sp. L22]|uniref:AbrB/MazE/SpoVT family DNA-binding domain-containing protein n=1 Tax=Lentibacillus TaxID=175304 RepID=UPI0022B16E87|nr:AbrB/MazE/SpoVT family DNA-binding domain-containing protein [Lentibacillus daqui]